MCEGNVKVTFTLPDEEADLDFGPIDPEVCVLRVEDMDGGIVGSLVNFGCHPVCIYPYLSTTISVMSATARLMKKVGMNKYPGPTWQKGPARL